MPVPLSIAISIESEGWPEGVEPLVKRAADAAIAGAKPTFAGAAELSVLLTDDARQRVLNRQWRGIDRPTNVLSFPQIAPHAPVVGLLGDLSLAVETLAREAGEMEVSFADHLTHLVVHGVLHLLGYDHIEEAEALVMERLETQILSGLGIADPYADR